MAATIRAFIAVVERCGPVLVEPTASRIGFKARMTFAALMPAARAVNGHVVLARRREDPRFLRIETFSPRNHLHAFRLAAPEDVDAEVEDWLREAYVVGLQKHLRSAPPP